MKVGLNNKCWVSSKLVILVQNVCLNKIMTFFFTFITKFNILIYNEIVWTGCEILEQKKEEQRGCEEIEGGEKDQGKSDCAEGELLGAGKRFAQDWNTRSQVWSCIRSSIW